MKQNIIVNFSEREVEFLNNSEICRIATVFKGIPHVVPVSYIFNKNEFYIATDYDTIKYRNILNSNKVALVVDSFGSKNKAVVIQGKSVVIQGGEDFNILYRSFHDRFLWVRDNPWKEYEAPFIKVIPIHKVSWGI